MSGHSKWHKIEHKKGKADQARSNIFTKLTRAVTIAAQQGGGDSDMNFSLRLAVEKAKAANVPKDNIERAVKRGTGALSDTERMEEVLYEGFGPQGIAFIVDVVTDNKNRSVSEIKHVFSKYGGGLGGPGSVQWQFERKGVIRIPQTAIRALGDKRQECELALMDAGAEDIRESEDDVELVGPVEILKTMLDVVESYGLDVSDWGIEWLSKKSKDLDEDIEEQMTALYEALDELDDVRAVYAAV